MYAIPVSSTATLAPLPAGGASLLEDVPGPGALSPPRSWNWSGVGGLAAERAAGQEVPLRPLPAAGDAGGAGVVGDARGMGDVVGDRVGDRRVGVQRPLGGGDVDARGQLEDLLARRRRSGRAAARGRSPACAGVSAAPATPPAGTRASDEARLWRSAFAWSPECCRRGPDEPGMPRTKHRLGEKFLMARRLPPCNWRAMSRPEFSETDERHMRMALRLAERGRHARRRAHRRGRRARRRGARLGRQRARAARRSHRPRRGARPARRRPSGSAAGGCSRRRST